MTKIVNLDELAAVSRAVKYKGESYPIIDLSVRDMIVATAAVEGINKAFETQDFAALMLQADKVFQIAVPTFPKEKLVTLNMRQVTAMVGLIMDAYPEVKDKAVEIAKDASGNA